MKQICICLIIGFLSVLSVPKTEASDIPIPQPIIAPVKLKTPSTEDLIAYDANKYGVSEKVLSEVIFCESRNDPNAIGDYGTSFGLSQIHLPSHRDITKAQAFDPSFAVEFMAKNISIGKGSMWTCYRNLV